VVYVPGTAFYTDGSGQSELRMSFCLPSLADIRKGAGILGEVFRDAASKVVPSNLSTLPVTG